MSDYLKYQGDAEYEAWRRGYNPDCIDRDRLHDQFYDDLSVDEAVEEQVSRVRNAGALDVEHY